MAVLECQVYVSQLFGKLKVGNIPKGNSGIVLIDRANLVIDCHGIPEDSEGIEVKTVLRVSREVVTYVNRWVNHNGVVSIEEYFCTRYLEFESFVNRGGGLYGK